MSSRLDLQRPPLRVHSRKHSRWYHRGYDTSPHPVWGDTSIVSLPGGQAFASGATTGAPGTWTPAGALPPTSVANLIAGVPVTVTATPGTAWTAGQYVQTGTAGAPGEATWTGTGWVGGRAP